MAYVTIPKDLSKIKTKFLWFLTGKQFLLVLLGGVTVGLPVFFLTRGSIGSGPALLLLFFSVFPFGFFATYQKDGLSAKQWLQAIIRHKIYPQKRIYKTQNFYSNVDKLIKEENFEYDKKQETKTSNAKRSVRKKY